MASEKKVIKKGQSFMKNVKFLKDHGEVKKDTVKSYHISTAKALVAHKIVEIIEDTEIVTVVEDKIELTKHKVVE